MEKRIKKQNIELLEMNRELLALYDEEQQRSWIEEEIKKSWMPLLMIQFLWNLFSIRN